MIKLTTTRLGKKRKFTHLEISLWIFRFSFYKLRDKFSIRFEISKGWEK